MKFRDLHPTTKRLILARAFRSIGQGALVVDLTLYLHALGWNGFHIGAVLSAAGLFGALLSLGVGIASDRMHRRPFLITYESIILVCSIMALLTAQSIILTGIIVIAGFGRGANGAAGPFSPVEQAWLAEEIEPERRGLIYSLNTALGFFGMAFGALLAMFPAFISVWIDKTQTTRGLQPIAFRPLFLIVIAATVVNLILIYGAKEQYSGRKTGRTTKKTKTENDTRKQENKMLTGLVILNSFNGMAIGLTGPLISYWFAIRFGVGPSSIAPMMAATFFITGVSALLTGKVSERVGIVKSVVWTRFIGLVLLILIPLTPFFWLASALYMLRSAFNRGSIGARQALTVGLVRDERRGLATSLNAISMQLPQSVGPSVAGLLFSAGELQLPFYVGALFQGIYLVMYSRFFRHQNKPQSENRP
ncbi:MAG: MFS transporter [Paludibacter sp.]|nr:MFS transporter [Paludibacter sp.]